MSSSHPSPSPGQVAFSNAEIVDSIVQYSSDLPALCRVNTTCFDIASTKLYLDIGTNYDPHLSEWEEQTPASSFLLADLPIFRPLRGRAVSAVRAAVRESLLRRVKNLSVGTFAPKNYDHSSSPLTHPIPPLPELQTLTLSRGVSWQEEDLVFLTANIQPMTIILDLQYDHEIRQSLTCLVARLAGLSDRLANLVVRISEHSHIHGALGGTSTLAIDHVDIYLVADPGTIFEGLSLDEVAYLVLAHAGGVYIASDLTWRNVFVPPNPEAFEWRGWGTILDALRPAVPAREFDTQADIPLLLSHRLRYPLPVDREALGCYCGRLGPEEAEPVTTFGRSDLSPKWIAERMSRVKAISVAELKRKEWFKSFEEDFDET